ncbi:MAG TPA: hypothetical protein VKB54_20555 [Solirubrobacteraceae bacterium]|nr:hypothetical protein [Solirubrobacteraceae bacterium]
MLRQLTPLLVALALPASAGAASHPNLWATVNLCDPPSKPGAVGIRVSIPREKGAPEQWARIRLQWFDSKVRAWRRVRSGGDAGWARIGIGTRLVEGGTTFTFPPPPTDSRLVLRGVVDVEWRDGRDVVDRARLRTSGGHRDAKDPHLKVSRSSCEIMR